MIFSFLFVIKLHQINVRISSKTTRTWHVPQLELSFSNVHIGVPQGAVFFHQSIIAEIALEFVNYFRIHESEDYVHETEGISDSIWRLENDINL